jgi:hypothetical protein
MRRFILGWRGSSLAKRLDAKIVNYADDLVICCVFQRSRTAVSA